MFGHISFIGLNFEIILSVTDEVLIERTLIFNCKLGNCYMLRSTASVNKFDQTFWQCCFT